MTTTRIRTHTPDRQNPDGSTTIHLKRCCNGCGQHLGDVADWDVDDRGELTDVRGECGHCLPLVEAEAAGCRTWQLWPRDIATVADQIDRLRPWVFTKGYWQEVDGKLQVVGLRVGEGESRVVAFFGDWIIRDPEGRFTVHSAPKEAQR
ncbi:hypothetical protein ABZ916_39390 [Streptomyces sp. NPDC046853]|uniref:hypothetical protein n=1 Tax=Streptomyces sp. NPDC046853 TaxID=3154920 RepID=UPI003407E04C